MSDQSNSSSEKNPPLPKDPPYHQEQPQVPDGSKQKASPKFVGKVYSSSKYSRRWKRRAKGDGQASHSSKETFSPLPHGSQSAKDYAGPSSESSCYELNSNKSSDTQSVCQAKEGIIRGLRLKHAQSAMSFEQISPSVNDTSQGTRKERRNSIGASSEHKNVTERVFTKKRYRKRARKDKESSSAKPQNKDQSVGELDRTHVEQRHVSPPPAKTLHENPRNGCISDEKNPHRQINIEIIEDGKEHRKSDANNGKETAEVEMDIHLKLFECLDADLIQEKITAAFKSLHESDLCIMFKATRLLIKENKTVCQFALVGERVLAINSLKSIRRSVKKELQTNLSYYYTTQAKAPNMNKSFGKSQDSFENPTPCNFKSRNCENGEIPKQNASHEQKHVAKRSRKMEAALKEEIEKALQDIRLKREETLANHKLKIDDCQKEINSIDLKEKKLELLSQQDIQSKDVLSQKLRELGSQETEFVKSCHMLYKSLQDLNLSTANSGDISHILKRVAIECRRLKSALPIYARRRDIVEEVRSNQVSVILGETGSGKSTQMAQYLYDAGFTEHGSIVCTQPRRIAAITLADRVADEMFVGVGGIVGYKVAAGRKVGRETKIFFMTDHSLLNECLKDPELNEYSCVIVDEAHERSIYTDILLGMIKSCLSKRPELKVIITSATIDPGVFIKYFQCGPELRVSGRTFPVDVFYTNTKDTSDDFKNYEEKAVSKAVQIHSKEEPGDILVFLSSPDEIMRCCQEFDRRCEKRTDFKCFPLHGQLPSEEQRKVFEPLPVNKRKIVFATNCAETSITIDGIKYVIDAGVAKEMKYDPKRNMSELGLYPISKSSAIQRKGRAGRTASGKCYRLYSNDSFESMESINDPEILRVHLGQAALKLYELGVNIKCYDFVQAPSETALNSAISTLEYLGAIVDNCITDMGRWIAKMPFDPKLGFVVYKAEKNNFLYDAVVMASVISSGSNLFYRGFNETEAQVVAKSKLYFGSDYGDTFTWLQIFKAWGQVKEKERSAWCRSHCINSKCISFAQQCIKDIQTILSREFKIEMVQKFSTETSDLDKLQKLLFEAYADSISNFSEVSRAGYFSLILERQVQVHPSSILNALNVHPEWLVYTNLTKTSREFIKGITVVKEEWVYELAAAGKLNIDIEKAKQNKFHRVHQEEAGPSVFRAMVGSYYSNLSNLEEQLMNCGLYRLVLQASRELGVLDVHSPYSMSQPAIQVLRQQKLQIVEKLMSEDYEFHLNKKESVVSSGTRVVIGKGGCVKDIFMPDQSDKVIIKRIPSDVTEEAIIQKFQTYGEIKEIIQFKSDDPWGFVRFGSVAEAVAAVEATCKDKFYAGFLKLDKYAKNVRNMFEVKLTWIRRPIKGRGTAFIKCSPLDWSSLIGQSIWLNGRPHPIKASNKGDKPIIFNTGSCTESEIKDAIINSLGSGGSNDVNLDVSLARETVPLSVEALREHVDFISSFIKKYLKEDRFKVNILKPKKGSIYYVCFVNFVDPEKGYKICRKIGRDFIIDGHSVEVSPCLKTLVHVSKNIKEACEERFKTLFSGLAKHRATELSWKELKHDFAIEIKSSRPQDIVTARDLICKELDGEIIDCTINNFLKCLLNKPGQEHLKKIEKDNCCAIISEFRSSKIHLYGSESKISKTQQDINSYLTEIEGSKQGFFLMRGSDKPPGLMKLTMAKFGPLLDGFVDEFKLKSVDINWKKHSVQLLGPKTDVERAIQCLLDLEKEAWEVSRSAKETNLPDCVVCMCPVETTEMLMRLEVCSHAYCTDCLEGLVSFAVNNKEFPLTCAAESCESFFVLKDIKYCLSKKWIREGKLVSMAVNAFVTENKNNFKFCLTPNCPVVYKVTDDENGCEFNCPLCFASMCTSCHIAFHAGLTCTMATSGTRAESDLHEWVAKDPARRKLCPSPRCSSPIEKLEGCNKMHCPACKVYFCWICLETSSNSQDCYRHLRKVHGGFF